MVLTFDMLSVTLPLQALFTGQIHAMSGSPYDRLHGASTSARTLCALTCAFELYNTIVSVIYSLSPALILHHVVTGALCLISTAPFCHFYVLFFFGVSNFSSVALASYSVCETLQERYPSFGRPHALFQALFAALFLLVRVAIWPVVSLRFWVDSYIALAAGWTHSYPATVSLLLSNVFLTGLQFMWGRKVWRRVQRALKGGGHSSSSSSKPASTSTPLKRKAERRPTSDEASSSSSDDGHDETAAIASSSVQRKGSSLSAGAQKRLLAAKD